jgi:hypothetical protein
MCHLQIITGECTAKHFYKSVTFRHFSAQKFENTGQKRHFSARLVMLFSASVRNAGHLRKAGRAERDDVS